MSKKLFFAIALFVCCITSLSAQIIEPIKWNTSVKMSDDNSKGTITFKATIDKGWHLYAPDVDPDLGPTPLSINYGKKKGVKLVGKLKPNKAAHHEMDDMFGAELSWWTDAVTLTQDFEVTADSYEIGGNIHFNGCNDMNCLPPTNESFSFKGKGPAAAPEAKEEEAEAPAAAVDSLVADNAALAGDSAVAAAPNALTKDALWAPVNATLDEEADADGSSNSLWYIIITCFIGGLVALVTPCVWPMIPLTVSFFLKKSNDRKKSIRDAFIYGISIIVIYVLLGILVTVIFGASSLNALATNAVCNIIFFLLLVVFAISFFGAFDIKLPDSWANKMDSNAEKTTGLLSIFFMAFTLTLVSFSCTGPIIGTLLVEAASQGNIIGPAVGMFSFALALAIPFCLFAMFPSLLKEMPKSGNWMNTVKVVLGFIELALSLKFLSVADLAYGWHILDRETFVALWIAIFGLLGLYLLGKIHFAHYGSDDGIGVTRFFLGLISLAFTAYLLPGLWGAPLKGVSAFVPPLYTQDFNLYGGEFKMYDDYDEGMSKGADVDRPILVDFSGYGCVNCRKMEAAVLDNSAVHQMLEENFTMIQLMVDEKKNLPEPIVVNENGKEVTLLTYGDRWSYLQRYKFNANAQPYYVILNHKGELLSGPYSYDEDIDKFTKFLEKGIKGYQNNK